MLFYIKKKKVQKRDGGVKVKLIYKPSEDSSFRLEKALSMLINEKDIIDYLQRSKTNKISGSAGPAVKHVATSQKNT